MKNRERLEEAILPEQNTAPPSLEEEYKPPRSVGLCFPLTLQLLPLLCFLQCSSVATAFPIVARAIELLTPKKAEYSSCSSLSSPLMLRFRWSSGFMSVGDGEQDRALGAWRSFEGERARGVRATNT